MNITWVNAVGEIAVKQGASWEYTEKDGFIKWTEGTSPTEAEIDTEIIRLQAEYDALAYSRARATSFPTWQDQLDMQYWDSVNDTTTWKDAVAKVKSDNPKE